MTVRESRDLNDLQDLLDLPLGPVWLPGVAFTAKDVPWFLRDDLGSAPRLYFVERDSAGRVRGAAVVRAKAWDTKHFGVATASLDYLLLDATGSERAARAHTLLVEVERWCRLQGIEWLSTRVHSGDVPVLHALEDVGFRSMDQLLHFLRKVPAEAPTPSEIPIDAARPEDHEILARMAADGFVTDRFHKDPRVDPAKASGVYSGWMRTALGDPAQMVRVARSGGTPIGALVLRLENGGDPSTQVGCIDIIVASPAHAGRGLASALIAEGLDRLRQRGIPYLHAHTQSDNLAAVNCYLKTGFRIHQAAQTFHRWLSP